MRIPFHYAAIDPAIRRELAYFDATDAVPLQGLLYLPPKRDTDVAVLAMHPRGDFSRHYLAPFLAQAGYAFFGAVTRYLNHDADALHERMLLDVAGAIAWLRGRGLRTVVLLGNSGGGSLFGFYLAQAALPPAERLDRAPSGDRVPLRETTLPPADGFVVLAAHLGEGRFLLDRLDPSVIDETNPTAANPRLDMYDARNGYRPMAEGPSRYSADFLAEYRAAQRARCERIDRQALAWCEEAAYFRAQLRARSVTMDATEKARVVRWASQRRYLLVYRTLADPRYLDPTLDPSDRPLGSIFSFGRDPLVGNYGEGLARTMSARGWLSTWSGLASHADLERTIAGVRVPTTLVAATADTDIYPAECRRVFVASGAEDKTYQELPGADHYLHAVRSDLHAVRSDLHAVRSDLHRAGGNDGDPRARLAHEIVLPWLRARFPA